MTRAGGRIEEAKGVEWVRSQVQLEPTIFAMRHQDGWVSTMSRPRMILINATKSQPWFVPCTLHVPYMYMTCLPGTIVQAQSLVVWTMV